MSEVKLIAKTKPENFNMSSEELISYCARVSNPKNQENWDTSEKLLKYLIREKHWSPFEMVNVVMEINTTRDIARQTLRHRSFAFQEFSQRYAKIDMDNWILRDARLQDEKNRQNSFETNDKKLIEYWYTAQQKVAEFAAKMYNEALDKGIAKEQARALLPEGLAPSRLYMNGTLRSWIHYCQIRMDPTTQKEHREIADKCWNILKEEYYFLKGLE